MKMTRKEFLAKSAISLSALSLMKNTLATPPKVPSRDSSILNFGAKADGKTDDTQAMLKTLKKYGECYFPKRKKPYIIGGAIVDNANIFGDGQIKKKTKSPYIIRFTGRHNKLNGLSFISTESYNNQITEISLADTLTSLEINHCTFDSKIYSAISADINGKNDKSLKYKKPAKNIHITNCFFLGEYSRPIYLHSIEDIIISKNHFENTLFDAIRLRQKVGKTIISKNNFKNIGTLKSADSQDAIDTYWSGSELIITENIIDGCSKHALDIKGHAPNGAYGSNKIIISNNIIKKSQYCGIALSAGHKLANNKFKPIESIIINSNIIESSNQVKLSSGNSAILLRHAVNKVIISSNQIQNNLCRGIYLNNFEATAPANSSIIISENQCHNNGYKSDGHGILVSSASGVIIRGNICNGNNIVGIAVTDDTKRGFQKTSGIITHNICKANKKAQLISPPKSKELLISENITS